MENADIIIHGNARDNRVKGSQPGLPRITFRDETSVFLGGKEVQARHYGRGHTNGDAVIAWKTLFERVRERITKLKRDGKDVKEASAQLKMDDLPGWSGPNRFWSEYSFPGLYRELATRN